MTRVTPTVDTANITSGSWTGTGFTITTPGTPSGGWKLTDRIVVVFRGNVQGTNAPTNAGFTREGEAHTNSADARTRGICAHQITSGEISGGVPSTYAFTSGSGTQTRGVWIAFTVRDVDASAPGAGDSTTWSNPSGNVIRTSISSVTPVPALIIAAYGQECTSPNSSVPVSIPTSFTTILAQNNLLDTGSTTGTRTTAWCGYLAQGSTGSTGNLDLAFSNTAGQWGAAAAFYGADVAEERTATGTVTASGTGDVVEVEIATSTGTVTASGTGVVVETEITTATGTVTASGSAAALPAMTVTAEGTVTVSGTGAANGAQLRNAEGVVTASGTAAIVEIEIITATGTVTASGSTAVVEREIATATGTVSASGSATAFGSYSRTATGTVTASGSADATSQRLGFSSVTQFLSTPGATAAWRLGGGPFPQHSEYAGDQSVLLGYGALEFSCGWNSDYATVGPFGLGPQFLDSIAGVSGSVDPNSMTFAHMQANYQNQNNPVSPGVYQPWMLLEDALAKYTPTHVMIVDPKYGFNNSTKIGVMLDICDANGGPTKILIKFDSPGTDYQLTDLAHARGYTTINYWGTDTTQLAAQEYKWDCLGVLYSASSGVFTTFHSYGKPVWAAVVPDQSGYDAAFGNGADFMNVSGVTSVTPVSAGPLGVGTVVASGTAAVVEREITTATGIVTASGSAVGVPAFARTATGTVTASGTNEVGQVRTADGALTASGTAASSSIHPVTATGTVTASGTGAAVEVEILTATGTVTASGSGDVVEIEITTGIGTVTASGSTVIVEVEIVTAEGVVTVSGNADGYASGGAPSRTATGVVTASGSGDSVEVELGIATGTVTASGSATAFAAEIATATGEVTASGTAAAVEVEIVTATGVVTASGTAEGESAGGSPERTATGTVTASGVAMSVSVEYRTATDGVVLSGLGVSGAGEIRTAVGTVTASGVGISAIPEERTATGTLTASGVGYLASDIASTETEGYPHMPYPDLVIDNQPPRDLQPHIVPRLTLSL